MQHNTFSNQENTIFTNWDIQNYINDLLTESYINEPDLDAPTRLYNLIRVQSELYLDAYDNFNLADLIRGRSAFKKFLEEYYYYMLLEKPPCNKNVGYCRYLYQVIELMNKDVYYYDEINMMVNITNYKIREKYKELKREYDQYLGMGQDNDNSIPMYVMIRAKLLNSINNNSELLYYMLQYIKLMPHKNIDALTFEELNEYNDLITRINNIKDPLNKIDLQILAENLAENL